MLSAGVSSRLHRFGLLAGGQRGKLASRLLDLELPAPRVGGFWLFAPRVNGSPRCPQQRLAPPPARAARWLSTRETHLKITPGLRAACASRGWFLAVCASREWLRFCSPSSVSTMLTLCEQALPSFHPSKQTQRAPPWEVSPTVSTMVSDLANETQLSSYFFCGFALQSLLALRWYIRKR
ncbi:hypothetical protein B0H11DRAFT_1935572 [Mycena galericulata]|nr:hypothetical protein B0H11DRAFT_1935561 [Mycena galericulata]KAJ7438043.1 hypothetical protein B0H11DRAFT_1935572 [Mycena galericulata]